jgi:thiol-disulfide isomerase/thioredoxin
MAPHAVSIALMSALSSKYEIKSSVLFVFLALSVFLIASNLLLMRENRTLKIAIREFQTHLAPHEGAVITSLYGRDIEKKPLVVLQGLDSRKTVLLIFSPECANCDETWPTWQAAIQNIDTKRFRVVGVNLAPELSKDYLTKRHVADIPVIAQLDPEEISLYNFQSTPLTLLLDSKGRVDKVWIGVLAGKEKVDFEQAMQISPGAD